MKNAYERSSVHDSDIFTHSVVFVGFLIGSLPVYNLYLRVEKLIL